jgi:mRNA interferase ChpB
MNIFCAGDIVKFMTPGENQQSLQFKALVVSDAKFNALGMPLVAPIVEGPVGRFEGVSVQLRESGQKGHVLLNLVQSLDLCERVARVIDRASSDVMEETKAKLRAINGL